MRFSKELGVNLRINKKTVPCDCGTRSDIGAFTVTYKSSEVAEFNYSSGNSIAITATTKPGYAEEPLVFGFHTGAEYDRYTPGHTKTIYFVRDPE